MNNKLTINTNLKIKIIILIIFTLLISCTKNPEDKIAVIWTDRVDFVSYCELFNNSQKEYKIIVEYKENPAKSLITSKNPADIIIGPWLKGKDARAKLKKINNLFEKEHILKTDFYPELLKLGNINENQYLIPVSFNLPMIIFSTQNKKSIQNDFTLSLDEIKKLCVQFNRQRKNVYTKMAFSPRWSDEFLYICAKGFKTNFAEEDNFFYCDNNALQNSIDYIRNWSKEINSSSTSEDDFKFKYLYDLPHIFVQNNSCLFSYISSEELFSIKQEKLKNIDFRWLEFNGQTPLNDDIVYAGIYYKSKNKKASETFFKWLFNPTTQKKLLETSNKNNLMTKTFGFSGGFSALREVTEKLLPAYYPLLLAHLPQTQNLYTPNILPSSWPKLKQELLIPYLKKACNYDQNPNKIPPLNKEIADWYKNK